MKLTVACVALSLAFAASAHSQKVIPPDDPTPVTSDSLGGGDDQDLFGEHDAADRLSAEVERYGDPMSEGDKQTMIQSLLDQKNLYGSQFAGANAGKGVPQWRSLGPTAAKYETNGVTLQISDSGRVQTILQDPNDAGTVYVLTSGGGLWKTTTFDHTKPNWTPKTDALLSTSGGSVAFGHTSNVLYLGLGDPFDYIPRLGGVVVRSTDGGDTWGAFASLAGALNVRDLKVDTSGGSDTVIVAADNGLFVSTNNGASFTLAKSVPGKGFWSVVRTSAGWLASTGPGTIASSTTAGGFYLSTDHGMTWSAVAAVPGIGRSTLAVGAPGDAVVYAIAATTSPFSQKDLYRSTNGGLTWVPLNITAKTPTNPNYWQPNMNLLAGQAWYNQLILVDPADAGRNTVYLGGQLATAKTTDGGSTWTEISTWLPYPAVNVTLPYVHADCHYATFLSVNGQTNLAFGTDGGIFISPDAGASWDFSKNDGIVSVLSQTVANSPKNPQTLVTGLQDDGTRARLGSSSVFNQVYGGDGEGVGWSYNDLLTMESTPNSLRSVTAFQPNTTQWTDVGFLRFNLAYSFFYTPVATPTSVVDPTGLCFFSALRIGAIYTCDGGVSWFYLARVGRRLPSTWSFRGAWHMIGVNTTADGIAFSGTTGRVAVSPDYVHYSVHSLICPNPGCVLGFQGYLVAPVWAPNSVLYVASESTIPGSVRVIRSNDFGTTWTAAGNGLPQVPVHDLAADMNDSTGNTMYAATAIGVYKTTDGGANWALFGAGLPTAPVDSLSFTGDGSVLRAALYGRGIWEVKP